MSSAFDGSSSSDDVDLTNFVEALASQLDRESVAAEIGVLQSIYGDDQIRVWKPTGSGDVHHYRSDPNEETIRYEVHVDLPPPYDNLDTRLRVLISLPPSYPQAAPPQLQLLSRYIGAFSVDSTLFGAILRTFMSMDSVEWTPDVVCVFDGVENIRDRCSRWYAGRLSEEKAGALLREDERERRDDSAKKDEDHAEHVRVAPQPLNVPTAMPEGVILIEADAITDRKSVFIGRACRIVNPSQVYSILAFLMSDRRVARAAHPIINAWRCKVGSVLHQDNDDDGETAAGGRLAHLLQILDIDNVLVVVTRYFGGVHLGPDRFKHINQAARNALERGGFLDAPDERKGSTRVKKKA